MRHQYVGDVYNLEFPSWISELHVGSYRFRRVDDYGTALQQLQHTVSVHAEFRTAQSAGTSIVTAHVDGPKKSASVIFSGDPRATELNDIVLLLSIMTGRDVVVAERGADRLMFLDSRQYARGGILRASVPYEAADGQPGNIGFEKALNLILSRTRDAQWQKNYDKGHFLILAREAFRRQALQSAFTLCWTIWEHLFAAINRNWLSPEAILKLEAKDKIAFVLSSFALRSEIGASDQKKIKALADIRNRVVHYGKVPDDKDVFGKIELFMQLTEFVVAKIFAFSPSNLFNTVEAFEQYVGGVEPVGRPAKAKANRKR